MLHYETVEAVVSAGHGKTPNKSLVRTTLRVAAQLKRYAAYVARSWHVGPRFTFRLRILL